MTVSDYKERFRIASPSLHETFVAMQGSGPRRRRRQRFWAAMTVPMWISRSWTAIVTMVARFPRCRHIPALMAPEIVCKAMRSHHRTWKSQ